MNLKLKEGSPVVLVGAGTDEPEFLITRFAVVTFTQELFDKIVRLRLGREISGAYEVTAFYYGCEWLSEDECCGFEPTSIQLTEEQTEELEEFTSDNKGIWQIDPAVDTDSSLRDDCTVLHVNDFGIRFTAYVKHSDLKIWTERIPYDLIYKLKF